jgi:uncharacterized protein YeaO (DUF488 family)
MVKIKRVYEPISREDGRRILVDRLWPRGMRKDKAHLDEWVKDIAPSDELRKWFAHDPEKWPEFKKRYKSELRQKRDLIDHLREEADEDTVTLLFAAKDAQHNNAVVLQEIIAR